MSDSGLGNYKKTYVNTANKEQILLLLYQAAIKNCKKAIEKIEENDIAQKGVYIGKLQDILIELSNSLDLEVGGKIAQDLASLYDYMMHESTQANIKIDQQHLHNILDILNTLYEGWVGAIKQLKNGKK